MTLSIKSIEFSNDPTSVVNRAYYAVFYSAYAFLKINGVQPKTHSHSGVISFFDNYIVKTDVAKWKRYSKILHKLFDSRQQADYDFQLDEPTIEEARELFVQAKEFYDMVCKSSST